MEDPNLHPAVNPDIRRSPVADPGMEEASSKPGVGTRGVAGAAEMAPSMPATAAGASPNRAAAARGRGPTPEQWATAYSFLSLMLVGMASACLMVPKLVAKVLYGEAAYPLDDQHSQLLQLNGGAMLVVAAVAAALAGLRRFGDDGALGNRGVDLLKLTLAGQGLGTTLTFLYYARTLRVWMVPVELAVNAITFLIPALDLGTPQAVKATARELLRRLSTAPANRSPLAVAHHATAVLFPPNGLALFYAPWYTLYHYLGYAYGTSTYLLAKLAGVGDKWTVTAVQLVLKEAADNGRLSSRSARLLIAGMLMAGLVHMRVLLPIMMMRHGGWLLPINFATWLFAIATSGISLAAGMGGVPRSGTATVNPSITQQTKQTGTGAAATAVAKEE